MIIKLDIGETIFHKQVYTLGLKQDFYQTESVEKALAVHSLTSQLIIIATPAHADCRNPLCHLADSLSSLSL